MNERLNRSCHEPVHDEEVFLNVQFRIEPFEIAGVIILCAVAQYKVLRTRGRTDRIGLDKAHSLEDAFQCSRLEKTAGNCITP